MRTTPLRALPAAAAVLALLLPGRAATITPGWPKGANEGFLVAALAPGEGAADLSLAPGTDGSLFVAWSEAAGDVFRVQRVLDSGARGFGSSGTLVRSGSGIEVRPASGRRAADGRGPYDLFPTSDGGVLVAWCERGVVGRDLRVQRLDAGGAPLFAGDGLALLPGLPDDDTTVVALAADGADGLFAVGVHADDGTGPVRFQRARSSGDLAFPSPGSPVDASPEPKSAPGVARFLDGTAAVVWSRGTPADLRFQIVDAFGPRLGFDGVSLGATGGPSPSAPDRRPSLRVAGSAIPGYVLVSHRADASARLLLVSAAGGTVLRDEKVAAGDFAAAPEVTTINATVTGLPEGIELRGLGTDGAALRFVRPLKGPWRAPEVVVPPAPAAPGAPGALAGPLWAFDLGERSVAGTDVRVLAYRHSIADRALNPALGPWLAAAPGPADPARIAGGDPWVFTAWVAPNAGTKAVFAARQGASGAHDLLDAGGFRAKTVTVLRPASGTGTITAVAPEVTLPTFPAPATPATIVVRAGSERGTLAVLDLVSFTGKKNLAWTATLAGTGGVTGILRAGAIGHGARLVLKGLPLDAAEEVAVLRIEVDGTPEAAAVLLKPNKSGTRAVFKGR